MKKTIMVTGGRGYIGSNAVVKLIDRGYNVIVVDDLSKSLRGNEIENVKYFDIKIQDIESMNNIFKEHNIYAVMHFAAYISVYESTQNPEIYFDNNTNGVKILLSILEKNNINKFIFSSTAAIYGEGNGNPLTENDELKPINPYGESKMLAEKLLMRSNISYVIFRYFNVAGADSKLRCGANLKEKPTHLIGSINSVALSNEENIFQIYGNDYETNDGTCIRDYIHVEDLIEAHINAIDLLENEKMVKEIINLGTNNGYSVKEVFNEATKVLDKKIKFEYSSRREGDPAKLTSSNNKANKILGWKPTKSLKEMIKTDYLWREKNLI